MWNYEKRLQYPVNISQKNPAMAQVIITQLGGPDGELAASMRYISQQPCHFPVGHDIALGNIAHGCRKLSVGTAQLRDDDLGHSRILL